MGTYAWKGTDPRGRSTRGEISAPSLGDAAEGLRKRGLSSLALDQLDAEREAKPSVTADAFTLFNRNLAEMTAVGLPLPRAIREFAAGLRGGRFKQALERVESALREGKSLDEAVGAEPSAFPAYYRWMLKAGAASGNLSGMLSAVARSTEGLRLARRAFLEATIYPALVVLFALGVAALGLMVFIPFYRQLSDRQGFDVPGLPIFLHALETTSRAGSVVLGVLFAVVALFVLLLRSPYGDRVLRALPLIGRIRRHLLLARLLSALGVMLRAGVPLPQALPVALGAAGSRELDRAAEQLTAHASEGGGLGGVLSRTPGVTPEVASFLDIAERTGDAPQSTSHVAELLMEQVLSDSETLFILLMPLALLVAGLIVGGLVISVVYPYVVFLESLRQ